MKRIFAVLLAFLLILPGVAGCGNTVEPPPINLTVGPGSSASQSPDRPSTESPNPSAPTSPSETPVPSLEPWNDPNLPVISEGTHNINGDSAFRFVPDSTAWWEFYTIDSGDSDPYIQVYDGNGGILGYNDDYGDNDAYLMLSLSEREPVIVTVVFWEGSQTTKLVISIFEGETGGEISGDGGYLMVNTDTDIAFTPNISAVWEIRTAMPSVDVDPTLEIFDSRGNLIVSDDDSADGLNASVFVYLIAGFTYTIRAGTASGPGGFVVTVDLAQEIPGGGGTLTVYGLTAVVFTPDRSGTWEIRTSNNGDSDPRLLLLDLIGGGMVDADDDSGGGNNALMTTELNAGTIYLIMIAYSPDIYIGSCDVTVTLK